jgi:dihydrolipoamide dehydrogenase
MVIIGGSVIGVEFATFLAELGVPVQIVEILPAILPYEEEEAATLLLKELNRIGVKVLAATKVEDVREGPEGVCIIAGKDGQAMELTAEYALLCTGRRPRLDEESLINMGIRYERRGIVVDERQQTNIAGIYAVGDVTGGVMLAHRAMQQGRALASRLFGDGSVLFWEDAVPAVTYSHPPIARVGLTELQAREKGWSVEIGHNDYGANIMARTELAGHGFAKFIFHKCNLVGATIVGEGAPDLIASLSLAMTTDADLKTLKSWIIPHPTLSEVLKL